MKVLSALATASVFTFASLSAASAEEVKPLISTKSTQAEATTGAGLTQATVFGGLGVGATAGIVLGTALLLTVVLDDDNGSTTTSSTN